MHVAHSPGKLEFASLVCFTCSFIYVTLSFPGFFLHYVYQQCNFLTILKCAIDFSLFQLSTIVQIFINHRPPFLLIDF